jgi:hypothetical protein
MFLQTLKLKDQDFIGEATCNLSEVSFNDNHVNLV